MDQNQQGTTVSEDAVQDVLRQYKRTMCERNKWIFEGTMKKESKTLLENIYTDLYITEGESTLVNNEHEIWYTEQLCNQYPQTVISYSNIFTLKSGCDSAANRKIRTVLTKGIAGIGKTVAVHKLVLDWAKETTNCGTDLIFLLPFRELNLIKDNSFTLQNLLIHVCSELESVMEEILKNSKLVFILDGLDECNFKLNFDCNDVSDTTKESKVDELLTNLIKGKLLPNALVWITSRPAAAWEIPSEYIHRITEIQGFNDAQKVQFFQKRFSNEQIDSIISCIKQSAALNRMCYIPAFCQISAIVLQEMLDQNKCKIPMSLIEMYTNLLLIQMDFMQQMHKSSTESELKETNKATILKLAGLAFKQLMKGNALFYEEDLRECEIDVMEASAYSGIFKEESALNQRMVYSFVHLSFQEFLAALYVFHCFLNKNMDALEDFKPMYIDWSKNVPLHEVLNEAVNKDLESETGHMDLFLRFLVNLSLKSNQIPLQGLLTNIHSSSKSTEKTIKYMKDYMCSERLTAERSLNLFLCLTEMGDQTLTKMIQRYLKSEKPPKKYLSPGQCSAIAYKMQMSDKVLNVLDVKKFNTNWEGFRRLVSGACSYKKVILAGCKLNTRCFEILTSVLRSANSCIKELDLSNLVNLEPSELKLLSDGLKSSQCKLEILRLSGCKLTSESLKYITSVLQSEHCSLKELDLSNNDLRDSGVNLLSDGLKSSHCKMEILRIAICNVQEKACEILGSVLQTENSHLRKLDLSNNDLQDSRVKLLSDGLRSTNCKLETLGLSGCLVTEEGCSLLASALTSNPSHMKELDLSYNHPGDLGVKFLSARVEDPQCSLETFRVDHAGENYIKLGLRKYARQLTLDPNTTHRHFSLSEGNRKADNHNDYDEPYPDHPDRFDAWGQVLCKESLYGRCYWETEWKGAATIAVAYKGISRKGSNYDCGFGNSFKSWSLHCSNDCYFFTHNNMRSDVPAPSSDSKRIGVYLDWMAGTLSFYSISSDLHKLNHLHTFHSTFTEPLYAGYGVFESLYLCELT